MSIEFYISEGICNGCDQDPAECYNLGYCIYDGKEGTNESQQ